MGYFHEIYGVNFALQEMVVPEGSELIGQQLEAEDEFDYTFEYADGTTETKTCAMFNMDNCFECFRRNSQSDAPAFR